MPFLYSHAFALRARAAPIPSSSPAEASSPTEPEAIDLAIYDKMVASLDTAANGAKLYIAKPDRVVESTLLVALISGGESASSISGPSGWTELFDVEHSRSHLAGYWKVAEADEPARYDFTLTASSTTSIQGTIFAIGGADTSSPINISDTNGQGTNAASHVCPTVTTTEDGCLILRADSAGWEDVDFTDPSGVTREVFNRTDWRGSNSSSFVCGYEEQASAGATGTKAFTPSFSTHYTSATIAIAPGNGQIGDAVTYDVAPSVESFKFTNQNSDATSITVAAPDDLAEGDLLVAHIGIGNSGSSIVAPDGWTELMQGTFGNAGGGVFYKVATDSEPSDYTFTWTGSTRSVAAILRVLHADTSAPVINVNMDGSGSNTTSVDVQGANLYLDNATMLAFAVGGWQACTFTPPTNFTEIYDFANAGGNGEGSSISAAYKIYETAPDGLISDYINFTPSFSNNYVAFSVLLKPRPSSDS